MPYTTLSELSEVFKYSGNNHKESINLKYKHWISCGIFYIKDNISKKWVYFIQNNNNCNSCHPKTTEEFQVKFTEQFWLEEKVWGRKEQWCEKHIPAVTRGI